MRLLVTGGAGFIGSNFIRYWLGEHPDDVVNFDKLTYAGNLENLKEVETNPRYRFVKGDITDADDVNIAMADVDIVVHFAAESHVDRSILGPAVFVETNIVGTQVLLDAALEHRVKLFHHVSTDECFGGLELHDTHKFTEESPYRPSSPYSASKAASDHLVRSYAHTYGLPVTITNCSNNFGPFQFPEKFIPLAITNLLEGKKIPIYGDGKHIRDWLYVNDHCRALELVIKRSKEGETYLVGGMTEGVSNTQVAYQICQIMGKDYSANVEFIKDRPGHDRKYTVDWSKIDRELGWKPAHDFNTWLKKTVEWYTNNEMWWQRVKAGKYLDYYQKQYGQN